MKIFTAIFILLTGNAILTKEKRWFTRKSSPMECSPLIRNEHGKNIWKRHERVIYYLIMGYLNATLTNKLILFLKITKFDQFIDKNVTECRLFYLFILC